MEIVDKIKDGIAGFFQAGTADKWFIYLAIFLMVIDLFLSTDLPTFISYLLLTFVVYRHLPGPVLLRLTLSVLVFFALVFLYYYVWGKFKRYVVDNFFAKDVIKSGMESLIGEQGMIRVIDGVQAAKIQGDLYPLISPVPYGDGTPFVVKGVDGGMIIPEFDLSDQQQDES